MQSGYLSLQLHQVNPCNNTGMRNLFHIWRRHWEKQIVDPRGAAGVAPADLPPWPGAGRVPRGSRRAAAKFRASDAVNANVAFWMGGSSRRTRLRTRPTNGSGEAECRGACATRAGRRNDGRLRPPRAVRDPRGRDLAGPGHAGERGASGSAASRRGSSDTRSAPRRTSPCRR
jgi:hypothetical protein